jgi:hypothetical protein
VGKMGCGAAAGVHVNQPNELQTLGAAQWDLCMTSYGCTVGRGVTQIVGTGGIVDSQFVVVLSSKWGTLFTVLGSGLWKMEKTKFKRDRVEASPITTCSSDKQME